MGKKKTVRCREKKIDGREQLQCDDPTGFGSQAFFALSFLDSFFFFVCLHPPATPHTCTAAQSKGQGYSFSNPMVIMKWRSGLIFLCYGTPGTRDKVVSINRSRQHVEPLRYGLDWIAYLLLH